MFVLVMMLSDSSLWNHLTKIMGLFYKKKKKKKKCKTPTTTTKNN